MALTMTQLPRAMLIDMDETILSAYGRPDIAWNHVVREFAGEFAPLSPQQVAAAILDSARTFWATAANSTKPDTWWSGTDLPRLPPQARRLCR
jgi:phosphoserine phosphatase